MPTTWSTSNIASTLTLDTTDLMVSSTGAGSVLSNRVLTSLLTYFEVTFETIDNIIGAVGICVLGRSGTATNLPGSDAASVGYESNGAVNIDGATIATISAFTDGAVVGVAVNLQLKLIWFTLDGNTWNNDIIANQNPVGNIGGISLATMNSGSPIWATAGLSDTGGILIGQFSTSDFTYTPPAGFSSIDSCGITTANSSTESYHNNTHAPITPTSIAKSSLAPKSYHTNVHAPIITTEVGKASLLPNQYPGSFYAPASTPTYVYGIVKENNVPVSRPVFAYDGRTGLFLAGTYSDPITGAFTLPAFNRPTVDLVAKDDPHFAAQVFNNLVPTPDAP